MWGGGGDAGLGEGRQKRGEGGLPPQHVAVPLARPGPRTHLQLSLLDFLQPVPTRRQRRHLLRLGRLSPNRFSGLGPAIRQADSGTCSVCPCGCFSVLMAQVQPIFTATQSNTHLLFAGDPTLMAMAETEDAPYFPLHSPPPIRPWKREALGEGKGQWRMGGDRESAPSEKRKWQGLSVPSAEEDRNLGVPLRLPCGDEPAALPWSSRLAAESAPPPTHKASTPRPSQVSNFDGGGGRVGPAKALEGTVTNYPRQRTCSGQTLAPPPLRTNSPFGPSPSVDVLSFLPLHLRPLRPPPGAL